MKRVEAEKTVANELRDQLKVVRGCADTQVGFTAMLEAKVKALEQTI